MARKLRLQYPGAVYHLVNRGDRGDLIAHDDADREVFLSTLRDVCQKTGWLVHAYSLLPDHFNLVIETPQANLVAGMKWFLGTYTARLNRRHRTSGHVFAGRYRSVVIEKTAANLQEVCDFVHLNPAWANLISPEQPLREYKWSSHAIFVEANDSDDIWLVRPPELENAAGSDEIRSYERRIESIRSSRSIESFEPIRHGWCYGSDEFRRMLLGKVEVEAHRSHEGAEIAQAAEMKAKRIIDDELKKLFWSEAELVRRKKGDPTKLVIAQRLRRETTVTLGWIAEELHMGTRSHLSHLLYWSKRLGSISPNPKDKRSAEKMSEVKATKSKPRRLMAERFETSNLPSTDGDIKSLPQTDPFVFDTSFD